jgi:hypothetical protein
LDREVTLPLVEYTPKKMVSVRDRAMVAGATSQISITEMLDQFIDTAILAHY